MSAQKVYVVIPNWDGADWIRACLDSLRTQIYEHEVVVVDNGSKDDSIKIIERDYSYVKLIKLNKNKGFTGGVNKGMTYAIENYGHYIALLNNDTVVDKDWLKQLVEFLDANSKAGIATSKICDDKKTFLDSTGDIYSSWGLPFPRGRNEQYTNKYDEDIWVFGASGGASLYRVKMLQQIGLFDNDYFAYYEDVDISFRAQLRGWKVGYVPGALVYHSIGATSSKIKGFSTYQTMKNLPQLIIKNMPRQLFWPILFRFSLAYWSFLFSAIACGKGWSALRGMAMAILLIPKKLIQRRSIQKGSTVSANYISSIIVHDLPPNASKLRALRSKWHLFRGTTV